MAPEAQLLVMKVFDEQGSTSDAALNAGLDDAVKLGADSINMSLGSTAGFYYDRGTEDEAKVQKRLETAKGELAQQDKFDYVVVNDTVERAVEELHGILAKRR